MADRPDSEPVSPKASERILQRVHELKTLVQAPGWSIFRQYLHGQSVDALHKMIDPNATPNARAFLAGVMWMQKAMGEWVETELKAVEMQYNEALKKEKHDGIR